MSSMSWLRALCFTLVACLPLFAMGCAATAPVKPRPSVRTEAVVVDFYTGSKKTAACSGTLLAQNVVLTAAHCTNGSTAARVVAPNAGARQSRHLPIHNSSGRRLHFGAWHRKRSLRVKILVSFVIPCPPKSGRDRSTSSDRTENCSNIRRLGKNNGILPHPCSD